ncbi:LIC_10190 family membrane protein [Hanstruepera ponticola]|uniref:LIC_10190 family membrane protein n=1 Tax=Hanstruepera ponticola TaxID=2042995 RepID=UPI000CF18B46|nr:hypothetical protein [Hanstruepera ponticola]
MLLILVSWIYILLISAVIGVSTHKAFKIAKSHPAVTIIIGLFGVTLLTSIWAIAWAVNWQFHVLLLFISCLLFVVNKSFVVSYLKLSTNEFKSLKLFYKILFIVISLLILAQCASPPFIIDNESYYIQTIKWLNEYGFVKGLVNLHLFLGQTSGWHILQSAFNFSFIYDRFNDLSGFMLLLGNYYAITHLNNYSLKSRSVLSLGIVALFPVLNVFFFQFISASSPDMAIYVLTLVVTHQFLSCYETFDKNIFITLVLLTLFMVIIKPTIILFSILPLILFKRYFIYTRSIAKLLLIITGVVGLILIIKNTIITGNPLFPLNTLSIADFSWQLPKEIASYFSLYGKAYGYQMTPDAYEASSWLIRFKTWLFASGLHGVFNKIMISLLILMPFIIFKFYNKRSYMVLYVVGLMNIILLFAVSPQYRFFFPFVMIFGLMILRLLIVNTKTLKTVLVMTTLIAAIPLIFSVNNQQFTANKHHRITSQFSTDYIIKPYGISKYPKDYKVIAVGNIKFNIPEQVDFFWGTGNIPLPAINKEQLDYFKTYFEVIPQQNTENLKGGFYTKHVSKK